MPKDKGHAHLAHKEITKRPAEEKPPVQSLDRGLMILEAVAKAKDPVSPSSLTALLGIDRSNALRLANTLKRRGFLTRPHGRKDFILGPSIPRLYREYDWSRMLINICHDYLKALASQTNATAHLAVREGKQVLFVDHHVAVNNMVAVAARTGEFGPLHCTAHGKALLSDFSRTDLEALFGSDPLHAYTKNTITSLNSLAKECASIKAKGFAGDDQEFQEGIRCIAASIRDMDGAIIGSIGVSVPLAQFSSQRQLAYSTPVSDVARQISETLVSSSS
jgi:DNA-binding IclR family transcriptional regulator